MVCGEAKDEGEVDGCKQEDFGFADYIHVTWDAVNDID